MGMNINEKIFLELSTSIGMLFVGEKLLAKEYFTTLETQDLKDFNAYLQQLSHDMFIYFNDQDIVTLDDLKGDYRRCCLEYINNKFL